MQPVSRDSRGTHSPRKMQWTATCLHLAALASSPEESAISRGGGVEAARKWIARDAIRGREARKVGQFSLILLKIALLGSNASFLSLSPPDDWLTEVRRERAREKDSISLLDYRVACWTQGSLAAAAVVREKRACVWKRAEQQVCNSSSLFSRTSDSPSRQFRCRKSS